MLTKKLKLIKKMFFSNLRPAMQFYNQYCFIYIFIKICIQSLQCSLFHFTFLRKLYDNEAGLNKKTTLHIGYIHTSPSFKFLSWIQQIVQIISRNGKKAP